MQDRIGFIDVGARGGTAKRLAPLHDRLHRVLVEPEPAEAERLIARSNGGAAYSVVPIALGHVDGEIDLFPTRNPTCTSALRANMRLLDNYRNLRPHFEPLEPTRIACARFDTLFARGGVPVPHAVKIDVQGFEYEVLEGFGALLHSCLALEIETHFYPLYENQRTIGEMIRFLSGYGFVLRRISNGRSPELRGDRHFEGDLVEVDAHFTKARPWVMRQDETTRERFRVACAALDITLYNGL